MPGLATVLGISAVISFGVMLYMAWRHGLLRPYWTLWKDFKGDEP